MLNKSSEAFDALQMLTGHEGGLCMQNVWVCKQFVEITLHSPRCHMSFRRTLAKDCLALPTELETLAKGQVFIRQQHLARVERMPTGQATEEEMDACTTDPSA